MAVRRMTYDEWGNAIAEAHGKPEYHELMGSSPGGAALSLRCSRQRVHQLLAADKLDMICLSDKPKGKPTSYLVTDASISRLLSTRRMEQPPLPLGKPKRTVSAR